MTQCSLKRALLYGVAAGMRTTAPLVACAQSERPWQWYLLLGELLVDKLPITPSRLQAGGWLGRVVTAAYGAYQWAANAEVCPVQAAVLASCTAAGATKIAHDLRKTLTHTTGLPDFAVALLEDSVVLACIVYLRTREGTSHAK